MISFRNLAERRLLQAYKTVCLDEVKLRERKI